MNIYQLILTIVITTGNTSGDLNFVHPMEFRDEAHCRRAMVMGYDPITIANNIIRRTYGHRLEYEIDYAIMRCEEKGLRT